VFATGGFELAAGEAQAHAHVAVMNAAETLECLGKFCMALDATLPSQSHKTLRVAPSQRTAATASARLNRTPSV
jgi:hypothetical protein